VFFQAMNQYLTGEREITHQADVNHTTIIMENYSKLNFMAARKMPFPEQICIIAAKLF
jgi:hypothetical protein